LHSAGFVLHHCQFFAARDDFGAARVRRTKENSRARQRWEWVKDTGSPGTGRKSFYSGASFGPFRGWSIGYGNPRLTPTAHAVGYVVSPSGIGALLAAMPLCGAGNLARSRLLAGWKLAAGRIPAPVKRAG